MRTLNMINGSSLSSLTRQATWRNWKFVHWWCRNVRAIDRLFSTLPWVLFKLQTAFVNWRSPSLMLLQKVERISFRNSPKQKFQLFSTSILSTFRGLNSKQSGSMKTKNLLIWWRRSQRAIKVSRLWTLLGAKWPRIKCNKWPQPAHPTASFGSMLRRKPSGTRLSRGKSKSS